MSGKQIKLFLVDGSAGGLTTAEITNWTGHVLSAPRSELADLLKREEAQRTGAYLLMGEDEAVVGNTRCYIGEADVVLAVGTRFQNYATRVWQLAIGGTLVHIDADPGVIGRNYHADVPVVADAKLPTLAARSPNLSTLSAVSHIEVGCGPAPVGGLVPVLGNAPALGNTSSP